MRFVGLTDLEAMFPSHFSGATWMCVACVFLFSCGSQPQLPAGSIQGLIPAPRSVQVGQGTFACQGSLGLAWPDGWGQEAQVVQSWLSQAGIEAKVNASKPDLTFELDPLIEGPESYRMRIEPSGILISSATHAGLFRGWITLRKTLPVACETGCAEGFELPCVSIEDAPILEHRGLLLDGCRHFQEVDFVLKQIDLLALHGMNVLHWHLTEDQGWRLDVPGLPQLKEVAAWRTEADGSQHGGFYTAEEVQRVVDYATARHIEVIPEIEMPGHSSAALAAYPELGCTGDSIGVPHRWGVFKDIYCAGNDDTFAFLEKVMDHVVSVFPGPRIHIGGDEAPKVRWSNCPKCQRRMKEEGLANEEELQRWFIGRMGDYLATKGKTIIGWDEILEGGLPEGAAVQSWRGMEGAEEAVHLGADVIVSPTSHCYLDYPLRSTDLEEAYQFDPLPDSLARGPGRILGGEGNMWTEHAPQGMVESKVYPRLIALAEVFWRGHSHAKASGAYVDFLSRLDLHYLRLDALDVAYGLESPPFELNTSASSEGELVALINAKGRGVMGRGQWTGNGSSLVSGEPFVVSGPGRAEMEVGRRGTWTGTSTSYALDGHSAVYRPLRLEYEPSPWYTGGGREALVDGRLGSNDFRDGAWQARQGGEMTAEVDLGAEFEISAVETGVYLYQDAWIFMPKSVEWEGSVDGRDWRELASWSGSDVLAPNDGQERVAIQGLMGSALGPVRHVRMRVNGAGPCPDWHAAAGSDSWLFLDELVVRTKEAP